MEEQDISHAFFKAVLSQDIVDPNRKNLDSDDEKSLGKSSTTHTAATTDDDLDDGADFDGGGGASQVHLESLNMLTKQVEDLKHALVIANEENGQLKTAALTAEEHVLRLRQCTGSPLLFGVLDKHSIKLPLAVDRKGGHYIRQMAVGGSHSLVVLGSGVVYVWGRGGEGQLGLGDSKSRDKPTKLSSMSNVKFVAAGGNHSFAVTMNDNVYAWGENHVGQLGVGEKKKILEPTLVRALPSSPIVSIKTSRLHTLFLTEDGEVYASGKGTDFQLGNGLKQDEREPVNVVRLSHHVIKQIEVAEKGSLVLAEGDAHSALDNDKATYRAQVDNLDRRIHSLTQRRNNFVEQMHRQYHLLKLEAIELERSIAAADADQIIPGADEMVLACKLSQKLAAEGEFQNNLETISDLQQELKQLFDKFEKYQLAHPETENIQHIHQSATPMAPHHALPPQPTSNTSQSGDDDDNDDSDDGRGGPTAPADGGEGDAEGDGEESGKARNNKLHHTSSVATIGSQWTSHTNASSVMVPGKVGKRGRRRSTASSAAASTAAASTGASGSAGGELASHAAKLEEYSLQKGAELQQMRELSGVLRGMLDQLEQSSLKSLSTSVASKEKDDGAVAKANIRGLIHMSNARIHELSSMASVKYGSYLHDKADDDPCNVLVRLYLDAASSRRALNDYTEGILEQTIRRLGP